MTHADQPLSRTAAYEQTAERDAEPATPDPYAGVNVTGCKVLLVEDERSIRELIVRCLRAVDIKDVTDVPSAGAAWASLVGEKARAFHVIITDLSLPDTSGHVLIKKLRELPSKRAKTLPIIVLSADSSLESYQRLMRYDISSYLIKPVTPALLRTAIARAISPKKPQPTGSGRESKTTRSKAAGFR